MAGRDYDQDDKINKFSLDQEWLEQGDKYIYWSIRAAKATRALEDCTLRRKILMAELYKEHRQNFLMDEVKFTDKMLDAEVHADPRYKEISQEQIDLQEEAQIMTDIKWNFQQRQARISELQQLFLSGYYSTPDSGKEVQKELSKGLKGRLTRGSQGG
jgi:hypothetical protein